MEHRFSYPIVTEVPRHRVERPTLSGWRPDQRGARGCTPSSYGERALEPAVQHDLGMTVDALPSGRARRPA
jgi:hypothetical protein